MFQEHPSSNFASSVVVLVPIFKDSLDTEEQFSVAHSLRVLKGRDIRFIAPERLNDRYYKEGFPDVPVERFPPPCFDSIPEYNRLLLDADFYARFCSFEFMMILQTDAIVLRDELDQWCALPYDYVGAPWPDGFEININLDCFAGHLSRKVKAIVGNGGLSLRRNTACIALLREFPQAVQMFKQTGSSEDLFFSLLGTQSVAFQLPNERVASLFSLELQPELYYAINQRAPMGGHAWRKYNQPFWTAMLCTPPPVLDAAHPEDTSIVSDSAGTSKG